MKQETNNEIDLLLRRVSRRDGGFTRDAEAEIDKQHLDADELSSYAQNALPAATRARYIEHLAECSRCRKLVTELSLSLGASTVAQVSTVPQPSALKKFLASLFSPMVLRYAVPALGVIVLAVVGVVVLRQQQSQGDLVVQMEPRRSEPAAGLVQPEAPAATPTPSAGFRNDNLHTDAPPREERPAKEGDWAAERKAPAATGAAAPAPTPKNEKTEPEAIAEQRPVVAADAPPPAAAPKVGTADTEAQKKKDEVAKRQQPETVSQTAKAQEVATERAREPVRDNFRRTEDTAGRPDTAANKVAPLRALSAEERAASRVRADEDKNKAEARDRNKGETRAVGGRRFRKERGIWVDTAYDSSKETTNVARGSEQFRALVADEPGIRTIAQQLDGEVIVVWKGRAYRIR